MPATEQTWRKQKLLHQVFAVSCVVLLGVTIWMFVQDHSREWKSYQKKARDISLQMNLWNQVQFNNDVMQQAHEALSDRLLRIQSRPLNAELIDQFKSEVNDDAQSRGVEKYDFARLDQLLEKHGERSQAALAARKSATETLAQARSAREEAAAKQVAAQAASLAVASAAPDARGEAEANAQLLDQQAAELRDRRQALLDEFAALDKQAIQAEAASKAARGELLERLQTLINAAKFREKLASDVKKAISAKLDAEKANLGLAVRDGVDAAEQKRLQEIVDRRKEEVEQLTVAWEESSSHRKRLEAIVKSMTAEAEEAEKKLKELNADLARLKTAYTDLRSTYFVSSFPFLGKRWLEMPILDAFNSPLKIENLWDDDNTIDYNFARVRRFDRCTTCHQAMEKTMPGKADQPLYPYERTLEFVLETPTEEELSKLRENGDADERELTLELVYGIRLAVEEQYLLDRNDVTISFVRPYSIDLPVQLEGAEIKTQASSLAAQARPAVSAAAREPVEGESLRYKALQAQSPAPEGEPNVLPGLQVGDVIVQVNGDYVLDRASARQLLLGAVEWGKPVELTVRRGLPNPYTSHPRLNLFVGSMSPHKLSDFACTICHEGQGSATAFKWASHTPNNELELERWEREHGWFDNHHWIFPMHPKRFAESSCLKCHHDVVELEPSERFPDPPAPKLVHGYDLIRKYGCYGCHEINGYEGPENRIGPDLRLEPNYFAAAQELQARLPFSREKVSSDLEVAAKQQTELQRQLDEKQQSLATIEEEAAEGSEPSSSAQSLQEVIGKLAEQVTAANDSAAGLQAKLDDLSAMRELAGQLARQPEHKETRHKLLDLIKRDKMEWEAMGVAVLGSETHKLADLLKDVETPGTLRKAGPSLRYVASKLDSEFLYDWIRDPQHFRESTRMPRFFGLWDHLEGAPDQLKLSEKYEAIEILGISTYLTQRSQQFEYLSTPGEIAETSPAESVERGKVQFQTRGCLACHTHEAFEDADAYRDPAEIVQGPDLSGLAAKFDPQRNPNGKKWLYSWIRQPTRYHTRTVMPDLFLDPIQITDADGNTTRTDPVADIVEFLTSDSSSDPNPWKPKADTLIEIDAATAETLRDLVLLNLRDSFSESAANQYLASGIPESRRRDIKVAETEMVVSDAELASVSADAELRNLTEKESLAELIQEKQLLYVGRKAIAKYGCYGCHDIPGFEDAKPIGTGLNNWGRKEPAKLAFEHILQYVGHAHGHQASGENGAGDHVEAGEFDPLDHSFYSNALNHGHRTGFIYQKLLEPRSYDYHRTENIGYNERLRMPQFPFSDQEREAVITFVLGLIADPPAAKFVYDPDPRQQAINEGRKVLEKYNCGGCHMLEMEKWDISFPPGQFRTPSGITTFPFMAPEFTAGEAEQSRAINRAGHIKATLVGLPSIDTRGVPIVSDDYGEPLFEGDAYNPMSLEYSFDLWQPVLLDGEVWRVGGNTVNIPRRLIENRYSTNGGMLAKYLVPQLVALERQKGTPAASKGKEAWGWVPPALVGEGGKVQSAWLHDFLLDPHPIRPAVVLRMPKFNMSSEEATRLVDYFAAADNADYPYDFSERRRDDHLAAAEARFKQYVEAHGGDGPESRFDAAMNIVVDKNYCRTCHLVADYDPGGDVKAKAPNLAEVYKRLRPNYMRRWIARPMQILPYTGMPENVKYNPQDPHLGGVSQQLYPGTSVQQVDGLVDLLMNFDKYAKNQLEMTELVKRAASEVPAVGTDQGGNAETSVVVESEAETSE